MQSLHRVEKSPSSDGTGGITAGDLSTQSIMGAVSICPIPARSSARDDDVGERPSRHFDRSGVEKSHAPNDRRAGPRLLSFRRKPVSRQ